MNRARACCLLKDCFVDLRVSYLLNFTIVSVKCIVHALLIVNVNRKFLTQKPYYIIILEVSFGGATSKSLTMPNIHATSYYILHDD